MEVVITSVDAGQMPHSGSQGDLVPLDKLIQRQPRRAPDTSIGEFRNGAFDIDEELDAFLAFVTESRARGPCLTRQRKPWSWILTSYRIVPGAASATAGCPSGGEQPIHTVVTAGELARSTKLRHWGPRNLAMPGSCLVG